MQRHQLAAIVRNRLKRIQYRPVLIDRFLAQAEAVWPQLADRRMWPQSVCR
jgi:hypothetical protein